MPPKGREVLGLSRGGNDSDIDMVGTAWPGLHDLGGQQLKAG